MKWILKKSNKKITKINKEFNTSKLIDSILKNRAINSFDERDRFLKPSANYFHNPLLMRGMEKSIKRIFKAISLNETIFVLGDSDADGISATSIIYNHLQEEGGKVKALILNREKDGRGLSRKLIEKVIRANSAVLITCDLGINDHDPIDFATKNRVDVIIADHHLPLKKNSSAYSIINPKQVNCIYPFKELSASGIALKLVQGMDKFKSKGSVGINDAVSLAMFGTISDMVPLKDENRLIVSIGLQNLKETKSIGLKMFLKKKKQKQSLYFFITSSIIPMVNSTARIDDSNKVLKLITIKNKQKAKLLHSQLISINKSRIKVQNKTLNEVYKLVKPNLKIKKEKAVICYSYNWKYGILGLVASKARELFNVPVILITFENKTLGRGSARSIAGFNLLKVFKLVSNLLESYGGHEMAVGFRIKKTRLKEFSVLIKKYAMESMKNSTEKVEKCFDCEIKIKDIKPRLINFLKVLEPHGVGNEKPQFVSKNIKIKGNPKVSINGKNLRFTVVQNKVLINAIGIRLINLYDLLISGSLLDILYTIEIKPRLTLKDNILLNVKDIRLSRCINKLN